MYDAVTSMERRQPSPSSLLPSGHSLDLFVTLTDYHGYYQLVQIHDPPLIHELDHHHVLHFTYRRHPGGEVESDFELDNAPALAFAARATSSFPGRLSAGAHRGDGRGRRASGGHLAATRGVPRQGFPKHLQAGVDPTVGLVHRRLGAQQPAVPAGDLGDPRPAGLSAGRPPAGLYRSASGAAGRVAPANVPGFFATLRGAMSDIPSSQPVTDELGWVLDFNDRVRRLRAIIDSARPHVSELVAKVVTGDCRPADDDRRAAHLARAGQRSRRARCGLRLSVLRAAQAGVGAGLRRAPDRRAARRCRRNRRWRAWSPRSSTPGRCTRASSTSAPTAKRSSSKPQGTTHLPEWVRYLLAFDVKYRERRLHFLIEGQNRLYELLDRSGSAASIRASSTGSSATSTVISTSLRRREAA